jgi:hypothetical protein
MNLLDGDGSVKSTQNIELDKTRKKTVVLTGIHFIHFTYKKQQRNIRITGGND